MVMVDIISNPFDFGLMIKSHFRYFILFEDVFSSFPVLLGINDQSATTVIRTLQLNCTMFCPLVDRIGIESIQSNISVLMLVLNSQVQPLFSPATIKISRCQWQRPNIKSKMVCANVPGSRFATLPSHS
jgi:hypothetical protein